jgi:hypothetical protein
MSKGDGCFYCRNCGESTPSKSTGWDYKCKLGMSVSPLTDKGVEGVLECPKGKPRVGFQIGGYYTHMWFEGETEEDNCCLEWMIQSDGEFPRDYPDIQFHICDFSQIERFVEFWGKELRRRGVIKDDEE